MNGAKKDGTIDKRTKCSPERLEQLNRARAVFREKHAQRKFDPVSPETRAEVTRLRRDRKIAKDVAAAISGDLDQLNQRVGRLLTREFAILEDAITTLEKDGVTTRDSFGNLKVHPAAVIMLKLGGVLGVGSKPMMTSPKERGIERKDRLSEYLKLRAAVRRAQLPEPKEGPAPIDVEVIHE